MKKILVANRGEIALRVMKTCRKLGIKTVAVYSEADRNALHVEYADEAVFLGPAPSSQSYLKGDIIIAKAKALGVDGIHPGYGFLSENAGFAQSVVDAGMKFIGPTPHAINIMGSKISAKEAVKAYGIPMVPGMDKAIISLEEANKIAEMVGYPILIKASAGGGGKGMRIVNQASELAEQMERAQSEALAYFSDSSVFIEKFIGSPRHIEIQVLADQHGNVVYLFERECSIQRRHQKLIEEAPSVIVTPEIRAAMGKAACDVARSVNYEGAGTVEFLMDHHLNFYFLEMNTRLQVEHPVTEMITGLDLVECQINVAEGKPLEFQQSDLNINGHAIELRICSEDPLQNFLPAVGFLKKFELPEIPNVRLDSGFKSGMDIPIHYDPMLAKLIVHGANRTEAINLLIRAIDSFVVEGVPTTLDFGKFVLEHPNFISGQFDTNFIKNHFKPEDIKNKLDESREIAALFSVWHQTSSLDKVKEMN